MAWSQVGGQGQPLRKGLSSLPPSRLGLFPQRPAPDPLQTSRGRPNKLTPLRSPSLWLPRLIEAGSRTLQSTTKCHYKSLPVLEPHPVPGLPSLPNTGLEAPDGWHPHLKGLIHLLLCKRSRLDSRNN